MNEIYPIVSCKECGTEHDTYNCPECDAVTTPDALTCPRCNEQVKDLVERKDGELTEGRYKFICSECAVAVQDDSFDGKYN